MQPCTPPVRAFSRFAAGFVALAVLALSARAQTLTLENYLGQKGTEAATDLGARASFMDRDLNAIAAPGAGDVVIWQSPLPGEVLAAEAKARFLVTDKVPVPEVVGMRVSDAALFLGYRGLGLGVTEDCGETSPRPAKEDEGDQRVDQQCVAPGTLVGVGEYIGVVISPYESLLPIVVGIAALAALLALVFFVRMQALKRENAVFKAGNSP